MIFGTALLPAFFSFSTRPRAFAEDGSGSAMSCDSTWSERNEARKLIATSLRRLQLPDIYESAPNLLAYAQSCDAALCHIGRSYNARGHWLSANNGLYNVPLPNPANPGFAEEILPNTSTGSVTPSTDSDQAKFLNSIEISLVGRPLGEIAKLRSVEVTDTACKASVDLGFPCASAHEAILDYTRNVDADLLVAGAHSVSGIKRIAFGSITEKLLKDCPLPMFLNQ